MSTESATCLAHGAAGAGDARTTVAVAVITRDRPAGLLRAPDAPAALRERPPVIVVDNSHDDSTRRAVRPPPAAAARLQHRCPGPQSGRAARPHAHTAGLPWVLRRSDPVPPEPGHRLAALERARRTSPARRYVG